MTFDALLDASVVFSFDRSGFRRHAKRFVPADLQVSMAGKVALVTGANSGLGFATAGGLAALGATVHLLCRDEGRGRDAVERLRASQPRAQLELHRLDVSRLADVRRFTDSFPGPVDVLVNNAGVLPPTLERTDDGHEVTFATNVLGPHALTTGLAPRLRARHGRVVTVTSGGLFTQRLDLDTLVGNVERFDGVVAYAQTKRAEVVLNELWAQREPAITFSAMHPGWADTPAVRSSLPTFYRLTRGILRTPDEGADTIIWLAAAATAGAPSGSLWFDRAPVSPHPLRVTVEHEGDRAALWDVVERAVAAQ